MEIVPGQGISLARIGESRTDVERRIGPPSVEDGSRCHHDDISPAVVFEYSPAGSVQLVELAYAGERDQEVTLGGLQLTYRLMDDVLADLAAAGYAGHPSDVGHDFASGFAIWSTGSLQPAEVDQAAGPDDNRLVVGGVSVAAPSYLGFSSPA